MAKFICSELISSQNLFNATDLMGTRISENSRNWMGSSRVNVTNKYKLFVHRDLVRLLFFELYSLWLDCSNKSIVIAARRS